MRIPVYIDIDFDLESYGELVSESAIKREAVEDAIMEVFNGPLCENMVDDITDNTGWCIKSLNVSV